MGCGPPSAARSLLGPVEFKTGRKQELKTLKIFYTTDIHGSETCFLKFLNSAAYYKVDVLIMGGDITGKMLIPVMDEGQGLFRVSFLGKERHLAGEELASVEKQIRQTGYYPYRTTPDELTAMNADPELVSRIFLRIMYEGIERWLGIAEERLQGKGIRVFVTPGNDDEFSIDEAFRAHPSVVNPEGQVVDLGEGVSMISTGYANRTPWDCPRDISEEELGHRIDEMAEAVPDMESCIFNLHCPPYDSLLDSAPKLDAELRPVIGASGGPEMVPVGSTAVAEALRHYQPLLGLHGHIHESKGIYKIGRTTVLNPGSEYAEGFLRGALVFIEGRKIKRCQLTAG